MAVVQAFGLNGTIEHDARYARESKGMLEVAGEDGQPPAGLHTLHSFS
jgi:hypothetical protein